MSLEWESTVRLKGRYTRTIQVYLACVIAWSVGWGLVMGFSHNWQEWYLFFPNLVLLGPMLVLYSKPVHVEVRARRLYVRDAKIDVTSRVKRVERLAPHTANIRFNVLYQLRVVGSVEQIDHVIEQLSSH